MILTLLTDILHGILSRNISFVHQIPLCILIIVLVWALISFTRAGEQLGQKYYWYAEIVVALMCLMIIAYEVLARNNGQPFLLTCLLFMVLTQLMGIRFRLLLFFCGSCFVTAVVVLSLEIVNGKTLAIEILLIGVCGLVNLAILYGSNFDSKKNFILR